MTKQAILVAAMLVSTMASAQKYQVIDLGDLGSDTVTAYDLNGAGTVVGAASGPWTTDADGDVVQAFNWHGFRWQSGAITDLGALDGGDSYATAINVGGSIAGSSYLITEAATDDSSAVEELRAIYLPNASEELIVLPGPTQAINLMRALDIDDGNTIVGYLNVEMTEDVYTNRGFVWRPDSNLTEVVGTLEDNGSSLLRNVSASRQQAVGYASSGSYLRAIRIDLASPDVLTDLGGLGGNASQAAAINDGGDIVGWSTTTADAATAGFFLPATGSMQSIGQLDTAFTYSKANDVNNGGLIVGTAQASTGTVSYHAVYFDTTAAAPMLVDLNTLIDCASDSAERWTLVEATAINDAGQIAGYGAKGGIVRAFLLNPLNDNSDVISCDEADAAAFTDNSGGGASSPLVLLLLLLGSGLAGLVRRAGLLCLSDWAWSTGTAVRRRFLANS